MGPTFNILTHNECFNDECDCKKNPKGLKVKTVNLRKVSFNKDNRKVIFLANF